MVKLRLMRMGAKKQPSYRIVAIDERVRRDGRALEIVGFYNPRTNPIEVKLDEEKVMKWLHNGAQPTDTVRAILSKAGIMKKLHEEK